MGGLLGQDARRFGEPLHVDGPVVLDVATGGLGVMLASLLVLHGGRGESLNVRGVWLHVATDALGSVGVIATGALIWAFGWTWTDLVASLAIAALIGHSAWGSCARWAAS
jgi:cobalt-zinc-cadmium efflux system protein